MAEKTYWTQVTNVEGPSRPLASGAMFPARADVLIYDADDEATRVRLSLRSIDGRPVLVGAAVEPAHAGVAQELSATALRELPLNKLTEIAVKAAAAPFADERSGPGRGDPEREGVLATRARRRRGMSDEELEEVARVMRENPGNPTLAVFEQLAAPAFFSYRTAARWVAEAKKRGFATKKEG